MIYLAKGKNVYNHVQGKNVYYMSKDKSKLSSHSLISTILEFSNHNKLLSHIHSTRLKVIDLG